MRITLKQLAVFTAIYRTGSVTRAGEQLALSQSALSSALHELERLLNTRLFERNGKKLVVNEAADRLYPKALALLKQVDDIEMLFGQENVRLRIGASSTIGNYLLPPLISAFRQQYPHIEIVLDVYNTKEICQGLLTFDYDLGFIEGENHFDELIATAWFEDELTVFSARQSRFLADNIQVLPLSLLTEVPLILREKGSGTRETIDKLILSHLPRCNVQQLSHSEAIKQAVCHDFGIGCLSRYVLTDLHKLEKIRYLRLESLNVRRTLWQVHHCNKHLSEALKTFIAFCRHEIRQLPLPD